MIELAKDAIDVGFFTESLEESLAFWRDDVGLPYSEMLRLGGGARQHRFAAGESVVKVNHSRHPLPPAGATTLSRVVIAIPGTPTSKTIRTPDGVIVLVEPSADDGATSLRAVVRTPRADEVATFWSRLGLLHHVIVEADDQGRYDGDMRSVGLRYVTAQVRDVAAAHAELIAAGVPEVSPPRKLGEVAAISFVSDPDGVPIEISQRASLVGDLPGLHST